MSGPPTEGVFSVEYGDDVDENAQAYIAVSYLENLMRQDLRDELTSLGVRLTGITGNRLEFSGRDRGIALTAGGKYVIGAVTNTFRPYVGAGGGIINVRRIITEARLGQVTTAVFNDFLVGDPALSVVSANEGITRPLAEAVAGIGITAGHTYVDVAYRFRRAFRLEPSLDFSQVTVGVGYRF
jgi:hypothetical protein